MVKIGIFCIALFIGIGLAFQSGLFSEKSDQPNNKREDTSTKSLIVDSPNNERVLIDKNLKNADKKRVFSILGEPNNKGQRGQGHVGIYTEYWEYSATRLTGGPVDVFFDKNGKVVSTHIPEPATVEVLKM